MPTIKWLFAGLAFEPGIFIQDTIMKACICLICFSLALITAMPCLAGNYSRVEEGSSPPAWLPHGNPPFGPGSAYPYDAMPALSMRMNDNLHNEFMNNRQYALQTPCSMLAGIF